MLENVFPREDLGSLARAAARDYHTLSVNSKLLDDYVQKGWTLAKKGKASIRLTRPKTRPVLFEHRVWTMLHRMGLPYLSGDGGATLKLSEDNGQVKNQLDVVAIDDELALVFECKTSEKFARRPQFQDELAKLAAFRERFVRTVNVDPRWKGERKRTPVLGFFLENINLSDNDRQRASEANVLLFDEQDLEYYEKLVSHLGPAARYQFYADAAPGKTIAGLSIRVPAIKTKIGGHNCFTFPVSPEYLLKIAYVSHRARGKASDIHAYQRMISKARLSKIREYISNQGIFPTNIVLNIEKKFLTFQKVKQETSEAEQEASGTLGWLEIRPAYKSAWVIDGQHRLFAYSGHPRAAKSHLSVLAFEGLSASVQAGLFVDINAKQKSVKQSLLQELYAELHWEAESPATRLRAVVSKVVQVLDADKASPLHGRVLTSDVQKDTSRCISFTSLYKAIARPKLFIAKETKGSVVQFGPLWGGDNQGTLIRTSYIVAEWLTPIRGAAAEWWALGSGEGGGLAMNDGVTALVNVLDSVIEHLETTRGSMASRDNEDLASLLRPFAKTVGAHLGGMSTDDRRRFRDLRGIQGQAHRTKQLQLVLRKDHPKFNPAGLDEFFRRESQQTNLKAKVLTDEIEQSVQRIVVQELKQNFQVDGDAWWVDGVPKSVRLVVSQRYESDDMKRGSREAYFDLLDYRKIAHEQWAIFQNVLGFGKKNESKDRQTKWLVEVNEIRNIVAHASSGKSVSFESLAQLAEYRNLLKKHSDGGDEGHTGPDAGDEGEE